MLKHEMDRVAAEMGVDDPNDPRVIQEVQRRMDEAGAENESHERKIQCVLKE